MGNSKIRILKDLVLNSLLNKKYDLSYIVESADWSIKLDGKYITENLNKLKLLKAKITTTNLDLRKQIVHFGSLNTFLTNRGFRKSHRSNKIIVTCFHIVPNDPRLKFIKGAVKYVDFFHTPSNITKQKLIKLGVPKEKIIVISLGVDLSLFKPVSLGKKIKIKKELNLPLDQLIVGSFQKDGVGWGEGLQPKLIKGPDIFVKVISQLKKYNPFVLLTGPARGYVKKKLDKINVPYRHVYLENFLDIAKYYNILDLYLITSRVEGGPKQILESWASGIPVVSTRVGMVTDIAKDKKNILLTGSKNINQIANKATEIIENPTLRDRLVAKGLEAAPNYSWDKISVRYFKEIYQRLL